MIMKDTTTHTMMSQTFTMTVFLNALVRRYPNTLGRNGKECGRNEGNADGDGREWKRMDSNPAREIQRKYKKNQT
jgi:hypothetical protein